MSDSSTGGYIPQQSGPIEGPALHRFLNSVIAGVTGIKGDLVRPAYQLNPPPMPENSVNWVAFHIDLCMVDYSASDAGIRNGVYTVKQHEDLEIACSFYGPDCMDYAKRMVSGLELPQNREAMLKASVGLVGFSSVKHVPELINERFYNRADVTMSLKRECLRTYPVLPLNGVVGLLIGDDAHSTPLKDKIEVTPPKGA